MADLEPETRRKMKLFHGRFSWFLEENKTYKAEKCSLIKWKIYWSIGASNWPHLWKLFVGFLVKNERNSVIKNLNENLVYAMWISTIVECRINVQSISTTPTLTARRHAKSSRRLILTCQRLRIFIKVIYQSNLNNSYCCAKHKNSLLHDSCFFLILFLLWIIKKYFFTQCNLDVKVTKYASYIWTFLSIILKFINH